MAEANSNRAVSTFSLHFLGFLPRSMGGILFAPLGPPDPHGPVVAAGGEGRVIGRECQAIDLGLVAFQGQEFLPGHGIPEPDLVAPASRGDASPSAVKTRHLSSSSSLPMVKTRDDRAASQSVISPCSSAVAKRLPSRV